MLPQVALAPSMEHCLVHSNQFSGIFPRVRGASLSTLTSFVASSNYFQGQLPTEPCASGKLARAISSQNLFAGTIPQGCS
eukprot:5018494-Amphidinium_carterae.1